MSACGGGRGRAAAGVPGEGRPAGYPAGPVVRQILPGGPTIVIRSDAGAPVVAMTLLVGVGSRDETPETSGLTALLGRVLLKGTRTRSALALAQAAEEAGGVLESATDQEYAELRVLGLARAWRSLLHLLHEVATAPSFPPEEVEREREAQLAHIRALEDQPFQVAQRLLGEALFGVHPYGLPPAGRLATVARLSREALMAHHARFFTAGRMAMAVSGAVPAEEVRAEAAGLFATVARGEAATSVFPPVPRRPAVARLHEPRPTAQAQLQLGFLAPPVAHPDHVPLRVLNAVLGGGMSSRLFRELRDQRGLAYAVGSVYPTRGLASRLAVHIGTAPGNLPVAEAGIREAIRALRAEPVPEEELARARAFLAGSFALDLRTTARQSFALALYELLGVGHDYLDRYPRAVEAVTAGDVRGAAERWLTEAAVAVVGPEVAPEVSPGATAGTSPRV